ncbi:hypothetical protein Tco_1568131 [Tanacetum coccineum]
MLLIYEVTPSDIQYSTATQIWGVTDWYQSQGYREPVVMSFASSIVTYTSVYTDSEPGRVFWGADEEISDGEPVYLSIIPWRYEQWSCDEEQPLPPVDSPTAESPGYVAESDPEEDLEEYEDDETEDGPVDYPMDGGDDGDDDDGDSFRDDADDEDEDDDDDEEEEHLALADSAIVDYCPASGFHILPPEQSVERLLADYSSPSHLFSITTPSAKWRLLRGARALPGHSLPLLDDVPESELPPRKRLCLSTLGSRYEIGESSIARPTGDLAEAIPEVAPMTVEEVNTRVTELVELHERDIQDLYALLEDAQDGDSIDCGGGGLYFPRGLGSLDRIESGDPSGALDPS